MGIEIKKYSPTGIVDDYANKWFGIANLLSEYYYGDEDDKKDYLQRIIGRAEPGILAYSEYILEHGLELKGVPAEPKLDELAEAGTLELRVLKEGGNRLNQLASLVIEALVIIYGETGESSLENNLAYFQAVYLPSAEKYLIGKKD